MKKILMLAFLVIFGLGVRAQLIKPVTWSYAAKRVSATEGILYVRAKLDKGWHIYSLFQPEGGPSKTSVSFLPNASYSLLGKTTESKPLKKFEKVFDMDVLFFEDMAVFSQRIRLKQKGTFSVKGKLEYMACDATQCLPPDEVSFAIPVK